VNRNQKYRYTNTNSYPVASATKTARRLIAIAPIADAAQGGPSM